MLHQKKTMVFFFKFHLSCIFHSFLALDSFFRSFHVYYFVSLSQHTAIIKQWIWRWIINKACTCHQISRLCGNFHFSSVGLLLLLYFKRNIYTNCSSRSVDLTSSDSHNFEFAGKNTFELMMLHIHRVL